MEAESVASDGDLGSCPGFASLPEELMRYPGLMVERGMANMSFHSSDDLSASVFLAGSMV